MLITFYDQHFFYIKKTINLRRKIPHYTLIKFRINQVN